MRKFAVAGLMIAWLVSGLAAPAFAAGYTPSFRGQTLDRVLPAEFERQDAILVSWDGDDSVMQGAVLKIVQAIWKRVNVIMLVSSPEGQIGAMKSLEQMGVPPRAVRFVLVPFDSVWTRDYGPTSVLLPGGNAELVDADYGHGDRIGDDSVPRAIAPLLGLPAAQPPINLDGGNLLGNGEGICITTNSLLDHNADRGYQTGDIEMLLRQYYGIREVVFLEPLIGEQTGHVDMFATFVSSDIVVVGEYSPDADPLNAEILDRNAQRLAAVRTSRGPLRVVRIPMPPHTLDVWRTYTNVLFANGTLVVPTYPGVDPQGEAEALAVYKHLLPGWTVVGVDCNRLIEWGGAVHCVTRNLCRLPAQFPGEVAPEVGFLQPARQFVLPRVRRPEAVPDERVPEFDANEFEPVLAPGLDSDPEMQLSRDEAPVETVPSFGEWQPTRRERAQPRRERDRRLEAPQSSPFGRRQLGHADFKPLPMFGGPGDARVNETTIRQRRPGRLSSPAYLD